MIVVGVAAMLAAAGEPCAPRRPRRARAARWCADSRSVLGAMFSAGVVLRVGDYLGQSTTVLAAANTPGPVPIIVPNALTWAARRCRVHARARRRGGLLVGAVVVLDRLRGALAAEDRRRSCADSFATCLRPISPTPNAGRPSEQVARAVRFARLTDRVGPILIGPALLPGRRCVRDVGRRAADRHASLRPGVRAHHSAWIAQHAATYGSWIITGFALATLLVVLRARSNDRSGARSGSCGISRRSGRAMRNRSDRRATPTARCPSSCSARAGTSTTTTT